MEHEKDLSDKGRSLDLKHLADAWALVGVAMTTALTNDLACLPNHAETLVLHTGNPGSHQLKTFMQSTSTADDVVKTSAFFLA